MSEHMDQYHNHFRYEFNRVYTVRQLYLFVDFPVSFDAQSLSGPTS